MKVENKQYCDTSKFSIREINKNIAKDIIVNNHYSGIWTKVSYAIGLFYISDDEHNFFSAVNEQLVGVAVMVTRLVEMPAHQFRNYFLEMVYWN